MKKVYSNPTAEFVAFSYNEQIAASDTSSGCTRQRSVTIFEFFDPDYERMYTNAFMGCFTTEIFARSQGTIVWWGDNG